MRAYVSDHILREIGGVTVNQSCIEAALAIFISALIERGSGITDSLKRREPAKYLSGRELIKVTRSLLQNHIGDDHPDLRKFDNIKGRLLTAIRRRNKIVHSVWSFGADLCPQAGTRITVDYGQNIGKYTDFEQVTLEELRLLNEELEYLEWAIGNLRVAVCDGVRGKRA